jgi:hypothetical protein
MSSETRDGFAEWQESTIRMNPTMVGDEYDQTATCECGEEFLWWQTQAHKSRCEKEGQA